VRAPRQAQYARTAAVEPRHLGSICACRRACGDRAGGRLLRPPL